MPDYDRPVLRCPSCGQPARPSSEPPPAPPYVCPRWHTVWYPVVGDIETPSRPIEPTAQEVART